MLALVKTAPGPGLELRDVPMPDDRHQRRPDPGPQDRDLRHGPAHRALGSLGGRRRSSRRSSSATSSSARSSRSGSNVADFAAGRPRVGRGPRRLRPLPPLPGRPPPPVRQHDRPRRRARRGVRRVRRPADDQRLAPLAGHRRGGRRDLRPVRQRRPHGARLPGPRRGRPGLRGRPDRADGHRRRPPRRRAPRRRQRAERLPPRARDADGRDARGRPARARRSRDVLAELGHGRGLRRRAWRCRATRRPCAARSTRWPTAAGSRSSASRPRRSPSTSTRSCSRC